MHCRVYDLRSRKHLAVALSLVLLPCAACHTTPPEVAVVPGLQVTITRPSGSDTVIYRRSITRGGLDSTAGTRTVVSRVLSGGGGARLLQVEQRFPAKGGEIVDTAVADLRTMRAIAHSSHQPKRTMRFDFVGNAAEGTVSAINTVGDSARRDETVHQGLGGPIFDSNVLELVVAALPLESRFRAELPFFIYERGGRVMMPVEVRERARVEFPVLGERDVWVVSVGVPGAPATVWVDAATREVLRVRYDIAEAAISFTDDRVTPLRS